MKYTFYEGNMCFQSFNMRGNFLIQNSGLSVYLTQILTTPAVRIAIFRYQFIGIYVNTAQRLVPFAH